MPTKPHLPGPVLICLLGSLLFAWSPAAGAEGADSCLECHSLPDQALSFRNGQPRSASLDAGAWAKSVHAGAGFDCTACHQEHGEYPHPEVKDAGPRDYAFARSQTCKDCHEEQFSKSMDGVHVHAIQAGNKTAAVCADCHDPHTQTRINDPETHRILPGAHLAIPKTCARCHAEIYEKYQQSAHGRALVDEKNGDVPTCVDCHGVHDIADPRTARFRLASPRLCADCHTDARRMAKYGLSTEVLRTYVADFHGSTVTLFQKQHPDQVTNKPVCYDCHGVHDIAHTRDPQKGLRVKQNLLRTCQACHPGATPNFPDSWLSHYIPTPQRSPWVYWMSVFYRVLIPTVVGGMFVLVSLDYARRRRDRRGPRVEP